MPDLLLFHNQGRGRPIGGGVAPTPPPSIDCFTVGTSKVGTDQICEGTYSQKVIDVAPIELIAYWIQGESSGLTADNAEGTAARDGTYTGVTLGQAGIGDGGTSPLYDGANDYTDIHSASLASAFNGAAGTISIWGKVSAGVWTDGANRRFYRLAVDGSNYVTVQKSSVNNKIGFYYGAGGTGESIENPSMTTTEWLHIAFTWDKAADQVKAFLNGAQEGSTQTGLGVWAGSLAAGECAIGSKNTVPAEVFDGYLAHPAIWTKALTPAQILELATV